MYSNSRLASMDHSTSPSTQTQTRPSSSHHKPKPPNPNPPAQTLPQTQIAPLHPPLITAVKTGQAVANLASLSTA